MCVGLFSWLLILSADTTGCLACGNNQGRLNPWSLNAIILKATVANWFRVVTAYPLGTQSGPLTFPDGSPMDPLWLPYGSLMVRLYGCANVARPRGDFQWFSMIFIGFHWFWLNLMNISMLFNGFQWFWLIFIDLHWLFMDFQWLSLNCQWFSMIFIGFHWF